MHGQPYEHQGFQSYLDSATDEEAITYWITTSKFGMAKVKENTRIGRP